MVLHLCVLFSNIMYSCDVVYSEHRLAKGVKLPPAPATPKPLTVGGCSEYE